MKGEWIRKAKGGTSVIFIHGGFFLVEKPAG